jgi:ribosomal protein L11 methyltransferase
MSCAKHWVIFLDAVDRAPAYWLEVAVVTDGEAAEAVAEALRPLAYHEGVVLEQQGDATSLDPYALEPDVTVKIYLPGDEDTPAIRRRIEEVLYYLGRLYPIPRPAFRKLEDEDWAHAWKEHYKPFRVGRQLWIQPSWVKAEGAGPNDVVLTLDPGMAFGTGLHPTTQMCLQAIEDLVRPGMRVLDVGTGSGILAITAALLAGARVQGGAVVAVDTDRLAVAAARENAERNGVKLDVRLGSLAGVEPGEWDLVVVNILAPVIVEMLAAGLMDYVAKDGWLLLSGIIDEQLPAVEEALAAADAAVVEIRTIRDWVGLVARHG